MDSLCSLSQISTITASAAAAKPKKLSTRKKESGLRGGKDSGSKGALVRKSSRVAPQTRRPAPQSKEAVQGTIQSMLKGTATAGTSAEECGDMTEEAIEAFCDFGSQEGAVKDEGDELEFNWNPAFRLKGRGCKTSGLNSGICTSDQQKDDSTLKESGCIGSGAKDSDIRGSSHEHRYGLKDQSGDLQKDSRRLKESGCIGSCAKDSNRRGSSHEHRYSQASGPKEQSGTTSGVKDQSGTASGLKDQSGTASGLKYHRSGTTSGLKDHRSSTISGVKDRGSASKGSKDKFGYAQKAKGSNTFDDAERPVTPPPPSALGIYSDDPDETPPLERQSSRTPLRHSGTVKRKKTLHSDPTVLTSVTANYETMIMDLSGMSDVLTPDISTTSNPVAGGSNDITTVPESSGSEDLEKDSTLCNEKRIKKGGDSGGRSWNSVERGRSELWN